MRKRRKYVKVIIDPETNYKYHENLTKSRITPREIKPDVIYESKLVSQLIQRLMKNGKKQLATRIVYEALERVKTKTRQNPLNVLEKAIENIKPTLEIRRRRIGGQNYQIPIEVTERRQILLAIRWLILSARERKEENMTQRLTQEIIDAANFMGGALKRKEEMAKIAIANRAFSHYRW